MKREIIIINSNLLSPGTQHSMMPPHFPKLPKHWRTQSDRFMATDGKTRLFGTLYEHENRRDQPQKNKLLVVLHGMGEHSERYLHLPHYLEHRVGAIYMYDQRGHGKSEGTRGDVRSFDELAEDAALVVRTWDEKIKEEFGTSEVHFLGHSMGGHVTLRMLILFPEIQIASVTVSAPFLGIKAKVPPLKMAAARVLTKVWGSIPLDTGLDVNAISHDKSVVECYSSDPLIHGKMTPRFFTTMEESMKDTLSRTSGITAPLQMLIPLADQLVDSDVSIRFFNAFQHPDKRLKTYAGFFHEPMNEIGKDQVFEDIRSWITEHFRD